ncbi:glycosyltransferase [Halalkalibaculum sp. DA3122]|uniref:glycosyltransferase n=1 Tax=Halalkalibaculum sp. DA3122 TaxID=3373607 RepID=UPI003753FF46
MNIAFILSGPTLAPSNGVVSQARTWKEGLERLEHNVTMINMWNKNYWEEFDIIHYYGFSIYMRDHIMGVSKINPNIVVSPILDPDYSVNRLKLYARWGSLKLGLTNRYHSFKSVTDKIKLFLTRSEFEQRYITRGLAINGDKSVVVPLSYNITTKDNIPDKEPFCFHLSLLTDERKNVKRLIQAANKYKFKLVLGGKLRNQKERKLLDSWIGDSKYVEYRGYLSKDELMNLYARAKVFALPSTNEGVGIVALEAAAMGCNIVITELGGPKEYYDGMAEVVDPYDIDEIGKSVSKLLNGKTYQPQLQKKIRKENSLNAVAQKLETAYQKIL